MILPAGIKVKTGTRIIIKQCVHSISCIIGMQQLFYGMTYLMILEKFPILISLRIF